MDLTPPSLTTSPASPQDKGFDSPPLPTSTLRGPSETSAASYPSPDLLDYPFKTVSPYLSNDTLPITRDVWDSPNSMTANSNVSLASTMSSVLPTSDYDNFSNYDPSLTAPFPLGESYSAPPASSSGGNSLLRTTPPVSRPASAATASTSMEPRSSFSYMQGHLLPTSKLDGLPAYGQPLDAHHFSSTGVPPLAFTTSEPTFTNSPQPFFGDAGLGLWPKEDMRQAHLEPSPPTPVVTSSAPPDSARNIRKAAARQQRRPPRKHTTREEANFQCMVKGCGKFFSRSYNFKSHMDTHDEKREYPFPCPLDGCTKKFVRKTDLQRHHQSVHMKERNHKCDYCGRLFARKDTLRRHMEDGCSKRFDIGTMDLGADNPNNPGSAKRQYAGKGSHAATSTAASARPTPAAVPSAMTALPVAPSLLVGGSTGPGSDTSWAAAR